jgi:hypothetical protein
VELGLSATCKFLMLSDEVGKYIYTYAVTGGDFVTFELDSASGFGRWYKRETPLGENLLCFVNKQPYHETHGAVLQSNYDLALHNSDNAHQFSQNCATSQLRCIQTLQIAQKDDLITQENGVIVHFGTSWLASRHRLKKTTHYLDRRQHLARTLSVSIAIYIQLPL